MLSAGSFVYGKLAGTHEPYAIIHSLDVETIFDQLCRSNALRCEGARIQGVLEERIVTVPAPTGSGSIRIAEEVVVSLNPGDPVDHKCRIVLVPRYHQYVFVFRTLAHDHSLRLLAKALVSNVRAPLEHRVPISGGVGRISSIELEVTMRAPFKRLIDDALARFRNASQNVAEGRQVSIALGDVKYTTGVGVLHAHFELHRYGEDMRREDGMPSVGNPTLDAWSLASDDVAAMYPTFYA